VFEAIGEPEIGDDDVAVAVEEEVLEFEVAVDDFFLVDVPDTGEELGEEFCGVFFFEVAVGEDVVEEFAAGGVFEDDTDVFVGFDYVVEADDVGVFECP
jgi:hypothetical protein